MTRINVPIRESERTSLPLQSLEDAMKESPRKQILTRHLISLDLDLELEL